jgi:cell division GTPase FtsZ
VASAGYGPDHTVVVDIFETVRSTNGLTVAVVLKPFSFEGIRRKDEVLLTLCIIYFVAVMASEITTSNQTNLYDCFPNVSVCNMMNNSVSLASYQL